MTAEEMKNELARLFAEFKSENDKQLAEVKAGNRSDPLAEAKLAKINEAMSDLEKKLTKRADEIETKANRLALGAAGEAPEKKAAERKTALLDGYARRGEERMSAEHKALLVSSDTGGGYLAPPEFVLDIIKDEVLFSPFRQIVKIRKTGSGMVSQPKRTGTAAATRVGEQQTRSESTNPTWGLLNLTAPEMYAEARVSTAELEDSAFDLEAMLREEFSEQFGVKEGAEIVSGTS